MKLRKLLVVSVICCMVLSVLSGCGSNAGNDVEETKNNVGQETTADSGMNWKEQYDLGIRLLNEGKYEDAILAFTAAIQINPKSAQTYVGRANAYLAWADAAIQDAYASLGEGETLVWSDITVSTSEGDKTIGDLFQNAADDFAQADELIQNGESTDELDAEAAQDAADKQAEALANLAQSLLPKKDEPGVLNQILEYLDKADELTDDEEILKVIDAIRSAATVKEEPRPVLYQWTIEEYDGTTYKRDWKQFEYDEDGNVYRTTSLNEDGSIWCFYEYRYDDNGWCREYKYLNTSGEVENEWQYFYDDNGHRLGGYFGTFNGDSWIVPDENGRIAEVGAFRSDGSTYTSAIFRYDAAGNVSEYYYMIGDDGPGYGEFYQYDSENRIVQADFYNMGVTVLSTSYYYTYDSQGRMATATTRYYSYSNDGTYTDGVRTYTYDDDGKLLREDYTDGYSTTYVEYTYNDRGELIREYHFLEENPEIGGPYTIEYFYE